jgi:hypothetical protein
MYFDSFPSCSCGTYRRVLAAERQMEVVARDAGHLLRLEAEQLADAVVLVDHVVADPEVAKLASALPSRLSARGGLLRKTCCVGQQDETQLAPDEPAARRCDREAQLGVWGERLAARASALDLPQERRLPLAPRRGARTRRRRGSRARRTRRARSPPREAAGGDRRALRLERVRLRLRERVELVAPSSASGEALLLARPPHVVRLPDESGARSTAARVAGIVRRRASLVLRRARSTSSSRRAARPRVDDRARRPGAARAA